MIQNFEIHSSALSGFPMGDSPKRKFPVYLPPSYHAEPHKKFPSIYWLSGWGSRGEFLLREDNVFQQPLEKRLDDEILSKRMPAAIIVFVDGSSKLGCSQYINSKANGNYSDYICDDLVQFIDQNLRTISDPQFRAIAGHSSGGFGALINTFLRPDRFNYALSSAGDSFFEADLIRAIVPAVEILEKFGGVSSFIQAFLKEPQKFRGGKEFQTFSTISLAPCYSPNLNIPDLFGDLYFDLQSGKIKNEIFQKYLAWDPIHFIDRHSDQVSKIKFIGLEAGISDEYGLQLGHRQLAEKLGHYKVPFARTEYPGGHSGHNHRSESRFKSLLSKMPLELE